MDKYQDDDLLREARRRFAQAGGEARARKLTPKQRRDSARMAAQSRWNKGKSDAGIGKK